MITLHKQSHTTVTQMNNKLFTKSIIQIKTSYVQILFAFWTQHDKRNKENHVWVYKSVLCK